MQPMDHGVELASPPGFLEAAITTAALVLVAIAVYVWVRRRDA